MLQWKTGHPEAQERLRRIRMEIKKEERGEKKEGKAKREKRENQKLEHHE